MLIANFVPGLRDAGYMEACMDWWLTYRTPSQMMALLSGIDGNRIQSARTFLDADKNMVFLEVNKR